jgi:hypothetical protein
MGSPQSFAFTIPSSVSGIPARFLRRDIFNYWFIRWRWLIISSQGTNRKCSTCRSAEMICYLLNFDEFSWLQTTAKVSCKFSKP